MSDALFNQSRTIRKLVEEGKTLADITTEMSLTEQQVKYRIKTRYSTPVANKILKQLKDNSTKNTVVSDVVKQEEQPLVVDTSSLHKRGSVEFIANYPLIILEDHVVMELERHKTDKTLFGKNIRKLLALSAKDPESKQYKVIVSTKNTTTVDSILLDVCLEVNGILYTGDNALTSRAKGRGIKYILAEDLSEEQIPKLEQELESIDNIEMLGTKLVLNVPDTAKIHYTVYSQDGIIKKPFAKGFIRLEVDDIIFVTTYTLKNKGLRINQYQVANLNEKNNVVYIRTYDLQQNITKLDSLPLPEEVKRRIKNYFMLVRK